MATVQQSVPPLLRLTIGNPQALAFVPELREALTREGFTIRACA